MRRVGAVVVFKKGISRIEAESKMKLVEDIIANIDIGEYDDEFTGPVWYLP